MIRQMQEMLLEAEKERSRSVADARIAQDDQAAMKTRLRLLECSVEAAHERWEAAEAELNVLRDASSRLRELQTSHFAEHTVLQGRRISALTEQLTHTTCQVRFSYAANGREHATMNWRHELKSLKKYTVQW